LRVCDGGNVGGRCDYQEKTASAVLAVLIANSQHWIVPAGQPSFARPSGSETRTHKN
jgi:hypothetical protein